MYSAYVIGVLSLINLERALRKGKTPTELSATELEAGAQKTAYLYTTSKGMQVVIKKNTGGWLRPQQKLPPNLKEYDCETIYQTRAGKWIIQEYVTPLKMRNGGETKIDGSDPVWKVYNKLFRKVRGDYHAANFGKNRHGKLVCFDW